MANSLINIDGSLLEGVSNPKDNLFIQEDILNQNKIVLLGWTNFKNSINHECFDGKTY